MLLERKLRQRQCFCEEDSKKCCWKEDSDNGNAAGDPSAGCAWSDDVTVAPRLLGGVVESRSVCLLLLVWILMSIQSVDSKEERLVEC